VEVAKIGGATAPVEGSGVLPTWIERVENPCCFFVIVAFGRCFMREWLYGLLKT